MKNKLGIIIIVCFAIALFVNVFKLWSVDTVILGDIGISGFNIVFGGGDLGKLADMANSFGAHTESYASFANIIFFLPVIIGLVLSLILDSNKKPFYIISVSLFFIGFVLVMQISEMFSEAFGVMAESTFPLIICYIAYVVGFCVSIVGIVKVGSNKNNSEVKVVQMEPQQFKD